MATFRTPHMNLLIPDNNEPGPAYAGQDISNGSLAVLGEHTHDGVNTGAHINIAGQVIGNDLNIDGYNVVGIRALRMNEQSGVLSGILDVDELYDTLGDLYFNDGFGNTIQITKNGQLNVAGFAGLYALNIKAMTSSYVISPTDQFNAFDINTTSGVVSLTLPVASSVPSGRYYYVTDTGGDSATHNITIQIAGSSGNRINLLGSSFTNIQLNSNGMGCFLYTDGSSQWYALLFNQFTYAAGQTVIFESGATLQVLGTAEVNGTLNLSSASITGNSTLNGDISISGGLITSNVAAGIQTTTTNGIESLIQSGIAGEVAGAISSNFNGAIQLAGGSSDWVAFATARTHTVMQPLLVNLLDTGWAPIGYGSYSAPGTATVSIFQFAVMHNGATLSSITVNVNIGSARTAPSNTPTLNVQRTTPATGMTGIVDLASGGPVSLSSAVYASGGTHPLTFTCNQNNLIDNTQYIYTISIEDENGANANSGNAYYGVQCNYTAVADMRFPT